MRWQMGAIVMVQYKENSLKPGKAYKPLKLTIANCAIDAENQAKLYAEWVNKKGLKVIHIYKQSKSPYWEITYQTLLRELIGCGIRLIEVEKEDFLGKAPEPELLK